MMPRDAQIPPGCADDDALEALVCGSLAPDREGLLEAHLGSCAACRARLDAHAAAPETWTTVREQLSSGGLAADDPDDAVAPIPALASLITKLLAPSDDERMLGRLGPYEIAGVIGSGGMGIVLKGHDRALDRFVAIKLLSPHLASSGAARQRFLREARAAAAVVHDNVIAIHGVDEFAGLPYLVMPYCRGTTLEKRLRDSGPMTLREILRVGLQTARGLAAAHAQGLVHRDVKPANILLEVGVERVRITDFGLARAADDASLTVTGLLAGTPHYMSPEQALGKPLDARSDLFALGAVLFTLVTGKPPFRAESSHAVLRQVTDVEPADVRLANPDMPAWFAGIVRRLLAKDPAARYQSAAEVAGTLESCLAHVNDPLATPLPAGVARAAATLEPPMFPAKAPSPRLRPLLDSLRRLMNDQRLLSIAALVIFLMAILLPWPILALGRSEPAVAYAVIAALASLLLAWLGRRDSLGRLVLRLMGGLAAIAVTLVALVWFSFERPFATNRDRVRAQAEQAEAIQAQLVHVTQANGGSTVIRMPVPQAAPPTVAPGPDPMPILTWPAPGATTAKPPVAVTDITPSAPEVAPGQIASAPIAIPPQTYQPVTPAAPLPDEPLAKPSVGVNVPSINVGGAPSGTFFGGLSEPLGNAKAELIDSLERLERWLEENPQEAVAEVTARGPGVDEARAMMTLGPDAPMATDLIEGLEGATTWQGEFTTLFLGRSLAAAVSDGGRVIWNGASTPFDVFIPVEEGDGFQQERFLSGDPATGAVMTRERRIRFTTDGVFRTLNRTVCKDFREVAPGIHLPHRIEINSFAVPDKPDNAIPKKKRSVTVVVNAWRPQGGAPPAEADVPTHAEEVASGVTPPTNSSGELESPFGKMKNDLADSLERIERWLAEHPQEAVADVTVRHAGDQVSERMTIGPGRRVPSDYTLNWDQKEFTTGFVGRSLAEVIRAGGRPAPPTHAATEIGVQTRLEDGDGFQQEMYISGDPKTGAVTTKELRGRGTLDGAFRTVVRTSANDFREVALGIRLPHRIDIETFDIDPNQPDNVIPKMANALTIVVEEWRPLAATAPVGEENGVDVESPAEPDPEVRAESTDPAHY